MTNENTDDRIHYLYRVTNKINGKIYIGQTVNPSARWWQHRNDAAEPKIPFHHAIKKYGAHNFEFEIIASCKGFDNTNAIETELVKQYDSYVTDGKGYNATHGGMNAPKSEEWIQAMKDWHASLSPEERAEISRKQSEATIQQIAEKGHPAKGLKWTDEQRANASIVQKAVDRTPTEEQRERLSKSHIGIKDSEETKQLKSEKAKAAWANRISYDGIKCSDPTCDVSGKAKYKIIDGIRYCNKHGLRALRAKAA